VEAEVTTWRVRVLGPDPRVDVAAAAGRGASLERSRSAWFQETGFVEAAVHDRYALGPGSEVMGPCVVEERESTVVIGPGGRGKVDRSGSLVVEVG
jgi:N-methylhydantoinase A/oxoprolinase/acetone carboxylase beta subunit